jgi:excisionase family DNA binding protein
VTTGDELRRAVVAALLLGRRELRRSGRGVPAEFDLVLGLFMPPQVVSSRPEPPTLDDGAGRPDPVCVSINEAAVMLGVGRRTVERMVADGRLASVRAGRRVLVPVAAVREYGVRRGA